MATQVERQLGQRVAAYRRTAGLTQEALAEKVGVAVETISRLERGSSIPLGSWRAGPCVSASGAVINDWHPSTYSLSIPKYGNDSISGINEAHHGEAHQNAGLGDDYDVDGLPAAVIRGGLWSGADGDGVFALFAQHTPSSLNNGTGFRCAR